MSGFQCFLEETELENPRFLGDDASSIVESLHRVGEMMEIKRRAKDEEIILYQTYLLLLASRGGKLEDNVDEGLQDALDVLKSHRNLYAEDEDYSLDISMFLNPTLEPFRYVELFHELVNNTFDRYMYQDQWDVVDLVFMQNTDKVMDLSPFFLKLESYSRFGSVSMIELDDDKRAFLQLRKALEGDAWANVNIFRQIQEGPFDLVFLLFSMSFISHTTFTEFNDLLAEDGLKMQAMLSKDGIMVIANARPEYQFKRIVKDTQYLDTVCYYSGYSLYILKKDTTSCRDGIRFVITSSNGFGIPGLGAAPNDKVSIVPPESVVPGYLNPWYYVWRDTLKGDAKLGDYLTPAKSLVPKYDDLESISKDVPRLFDDTMDCDPGLAPTRLDTTRKSPCSLYPIRDYLLVLDKDDWKDKWNVDYVRAGDAKPSLTNATPQGSEPFGCVGIGFGLEVFEVDTEKADVRYLVKTIRDLNPPKRLDMNPEAVLSLRIPKISLDQQKARVAEYLKARSKEMLRGIGADGDREARIVVATPYFEKFRTRFTRQLEDNIFTVIDSCEDPDGLGRLIESHFGSRVLASAKADLVLISTGFGQQEVENALMEILSRQNLGADARFFDELDGFGGRFNFGLRKSAAVFNERYVPGEDFLKQIREDLDRSAPNIYTRYEAFFTAAEHLDKDYGWGLARYGAEVLSSDPFTLDGTEKNFRTMLHDTLCKFFIMNGQAPEDLDPGAVPQLIQQGTYTDKGKNNGKRRIELLNNSLPNEVYVAEKWYKTAFVYLAQFGNEYSHKDKMKVFTSCDTPKAAFSLFMEVVTWLERVRERYENGTITFKETPIK